MEQVRARGGREALAACHSDPGEVAAAGTAPCTQMGNGRFGNDAAPAAYDDLYRFEPDGTRCRPAR